MSRRNASTQWRANLEEANKVWGGSKFWAHRLRTPERAADYWTAVDTSRNLGSVYLNRWKPETREAIREAREATKRAYEAMVREMDQ